jgi:predicted alpha/beta-fold hydrolase
LGQDFLAVLEELVVQDGMDAVYLAGYSMGGNLALNAAGQAEDSFPALRGIAVVCPNIHPALAVEALERPRNWLYQRHFLKSLQTRMYRKATYFPGLYDLAHLKTISSLREFDNRYTAPSGGFADAAEYYEKTGARHALSRIKVPTLIIASKDDPFIPFRSFDVPALEANPRICFVATTHGGHCGFLQRRSGREDMYWAENRIVEFCLAQEQERRK